MDAGSAYKDTDNRTGQLAWGASYVMEAYLIMYEATGDTAYLDVLGELSDAVLANRDSERGWTDYRGLSLPGWSAAGHYSIGEVVLADDSGRPALHLRVSSTGHNEKTRVYVKPTNGAADLFDLRLVNQENRYDESFSGLSLDPDDERYVVDVLNASRLADPWGGVRLFVEDQHQGGESAGRTLAPGAYSFVPPPYHWPVHQGRITYPMIAFARIVYNDPVLRGVERYKARADSYIAATRATLAMLEDNWRENEAGEGWYIVERGASVWMDGIDEPHNHSLALGRSIIELAVITQEEKWLDRAEKMARTIHNDLELLSNGSYTWPYWWSKGHGHQGWSPQEDLSTNTPALRPRPTPEDVSHGAIEVEFAYLAHENGILFTETDMERLARTFTENILVQRAGGSHTLARYVDGSGEPAYYDDNVAGRYLVLAQWDPGIYDVVREMFGSRALRSSAGDLIGVARLNWARALLDAAGSRGEIGDQLSKAPRITIKTPDSGLYELARLSGVKPVDVSVWAASQRTITRVRVSIEEKAVYDATRPPAPGEILLDTFSLPDGMHTLMVEVEDDHGGHRAHSTQFMVANRWAHQTALDPPIQTMFGEVVRTRLHDQSGGWRHPGAGENDLFGDEGRMVYEGDGLGHLVWEGQQLERSPEIEEFSIHVYIRDVTPEEAVTVALSWDESHWTSLPYDVRVVATSGEWQHLELTGTVPAPTGGRYFRLSVADDVGANLQLGSVRIGGVWRE